MTTPAIERLEPADRHAAGSFFLAPETASAARLDVRDLSSRPAWDLAVRYREIAESRAVPEALRRRLSRAAVEEIVRRARHSTGRPLRRERPIVTDLEGLAGGAGSAEPDPEESLQSGYRPSATPAARSNALRFAVRAPVERGIVVGLDASLSMQGEKLALLAVSAAAIALAVPQRSLALFAFESRIHPIKPFGEEAPPPVIVERILRLAGGGLTNLERALKEARRLAGTAPFADPRVLLVSDGKYTEGADPARLARWFGSLNVLKPGKDRAGRGLLEDLCRPSAGRIFAARSMAELPRAAYAAIRALMR